MAHESESRQALRKKHIRARESLSPAERETYALRAAERIVSLPDFRNASVVMLYRAVCGEMNLDFLPEHPAAAGKHFAYPRCISRKEMAAMVPGGWETGAYGIPEPAADSSVTFPPESIDLVICPGTAFDTRGVRLGMGAGYYDRFLPECTKAVFLMAAFEAQRAERLPRNETDVPMDIIVTEEAVIRCVRSEKDAIKGEASCD